MKLFCLRLKKAYSREKGKLNFILIILSPHIQDQTFHGKPGSNSISYALELGTSVLICGDGAYLGVQPATAEQTSRQQITSSWSVPLYHPPNGLHGSIDVDADAATREWLLIKSQRSLNYFLLVIKFHTQEEEGIHSQVLPNRTFSFWKIAVERFFESIMWRCLIISEPALLKNAVINHPRFSRLPTFWLVFGVEALLLSF